MSPPLSEEILAKPAYLELVERELSFRSTAGKHEYKHQIEDLRGHAARLRGLLKAANENQALYILKAVEYEADAARGGTGVVGLGIGSGVGIELGPCGRWR